jgi:hypothetical protein
MGSHLGPSMFCLRQHESAIKFIVNISFLKKLIQYNHTD